jgi:GAF domain-containing protein
VSSNDGHFMAGIQGELSLCAVELEAADSWRDVQDAVRFGARRLTQADGATFVLRDGEHCYYVDEDAVSPLWKGQRFPIGQCISGWAMLNAATAVVPDITADPRVPLDAYLPTFVRSLVMVPIGRPQPLGAIGAYWASLRRPAPTAIAALEQLAELTAETIARIGVDTAPWAPNFRAHRVIRLDPEEPATKTAAS